MQINEFVKLGGDQLVPYYADILGAILPSISDTEEKIRVVSCFYHCFCHYHMVSFHKTNAKTTIFGVIYFQVARETNEELRSFKAAPSEGFDVGAILSVAKR